MADQETCCRIEKQSVIKFLIAQGCKKVKIHKRMSTVYGATRRSDFLNFQILILVPCREVRGW